MKGWQTACIPNNDVFLQYQEGNEITLSVIIYPEWLEDFEPGNKLEVFLSSNTPGHSHFTGYITQNHGLIRKISRGEANLLSVSVKRAT